MTTTVRVPTNGITSSVALSDDDPAGDRTLCVLLHGWPELGRSWRHQIPFLRDLGYRVAAPDVRGFGASDAPREVSAYGMRTLVADVVALIDALGHDDAIVIGHDWGAPIAWHTALLAPDKVRAVVGMSVPHLGRGGPAPPTELLAQLYAGRFFYILYFQEQGAPEAEFEVDVRDALTKIYFSNSGDAGRDVRRAMRARTRGYLEGLPSPDPFPAWLPPDELDRYVAAYEASGFHGGLNRYRNMDADWHDLPELADMRVTQPALFIAGEHDSVLRYAPGMNLLDAMGAFYDDLRAKVIVPGCGHWVQQEKPAEVNEALAAFLRTL